MITSPLAATVTTKAGYERVECKPCKGSGRMPKGKGFYTHKSDRRRKPLCQSCGGYGFNAVKIEKLPTGAEIAQAQNDQRAKDLGLPPPFYGAQCPSYPACTGGCGLGCTREIEQARRLPE